MTNVNLDLIGRPIDDSATRERVLAEFEDHLTGFSRADPPLANSPFPIRSFNAGYRDEGLDWPATALTMVGRQRLHNFRVLIERVVSEDVPGDIIETGVWRGGASILARAVLAALGVTDRKVIVADSFDGLPPPEHPTDRNFSPADKGFELHTYSDLAVSLEQVKANFAQFGLLDDQVEFVKGWFRDTMPLVQTPVFAILRLDGDMYESTIDPLTHLYDRLSDGGFVIVDDYYLIKPCAAAVGDFFEARGVEAPAMVPIDRVGGYFQKPAP